MAADRCEECGRIVGDGKGHWYPDLAGPWPWAGGLDTTKHAAAAADYGASHFFCDSCLETLELAQARELGELDLVDCE